MTRKKSHRYFLCVENKGVSASLRVRTVYLGLPDAGAEAHGMIRIIDESGEDYLFPAAFFVPIEIPDAAARAFPGAA